MKLSILTAVLTAAFMTSSPNEVRAVDNAAEPASVIISAGSISLNPQEQSVVATGDVRLTAGDLTLETEFLKMDSAGARIETDTTFVLRRNEQLITGTHLQFIPGTRQLTIDEMRTDLSRGASRVHLRAGRMICEGETCVLECAEGSMCPISGRGFSIRAKSLRLFENGATTLYDPVLTVNTTPLIALPWLHITAPDQPGFLMPILGWSPSGGLIIGPAGVIPVGAGEISGHVAVRTSSGFEDSLTLSLPNQELAVHHLLDDGTHHGMLTGSLHAPLNNAQAAADLELVSSQKMIDETSFLNEDRAATHTRSQAAISIDRELFFLGSSLSHLQDLDDPLHRSLNTADISWRFNYAVGAFPVVPSIYSSFRRVFDETTDLSNPANTDTSPTFSRLQVSPSLSFPFSAGPFATNTTLSSLHQVWLIDQSNITQGKHVISAGTEISLPLARRLRRATHRLTPSLAFQTSPWSAGDDPIVRTDDWDAVVTGSGFKALLGNEWRGISGRADGYMNLSLQGEFNTTASPSTRAFARIDGGAVSAFLDCHAALSLDATTGIPDHGRFWLQFKDTSGNALSSGVSWYGDDSGHYATRFNSGGTPWRYAPLRTFTEEQLSLREGVVISITEWLFATMDTTIALLPDARLTSLVYGIEYRSTCDGITVLLQASHRFSEAAPDIRALLTWNLPKR